MAYMIRPARPTLLAAAQDQIGGIRADAAIRVALPILGGLLTTGGLVLSTFGNQRWAAMIAITGTLLGAVAIAGEVFAAEEAAGRLR